MAHTTQDFGRGGAPLMFAAASLGTSGTRYLFPGRTDGTANPSIKPMDAPRAYRTVKMRFRASGAGTGTGTYTLSLCKVVAGVATATALAMTINATAASGSVTAEVDIDDGDTLALQTVASGTISASPTDPVITIDMVAR